MKGNLLFPVFLKLDNLQVLIVGGGFIGLEKVTSIYRNSPNAVVKLVAPEVLDEIVEFSTTPNHNLTIVKKEFNSSDLDGIDLAIAATSIQDLNYLVWQEAKARKIIVNVADTPDLCDFYMCSIVQKGDLKIGISSNGLSPTLTKRLREILDEAIPDEIDDILKALKEIRDTLKGDFEYKVKKMQEITATFNEKKPDENQ